MKVIMIARLAILAIAGVLVGSCTVDVDGPARPLPPRADHAQFCPEQYAPVCAARGEQRRTFSNLCLASREGYRVQHFGECQASRPPARGRTQACTREYRPVCAVRGGNSRTFPNACEADSQGFRVIHSGECRASSPDRPDRPDRSRGPDRRSQQACTMEYRPVCAANAGRLRTFGNACQANAEGWRIVRQGQC